MASPLQLEGRKFGLLKVLKQIWSPDDHTWWLCLCECGAYLTRPGYRINGGFVKSCGCLRRRRPSDERIAITSAATTRIAKEAVTRIFACGEKSCSKCKAVKPLSKFSLQTGQLVGYKSHCKMCIQDYTRRNKAHIKEKSRVNYIRNRIAHPLRARKYRFRLEPEDFLRMLTEQGGKCAICQTGEPGAGRDWHVDHDHACCPSNAKTCGKCTRALLCAKCNWTLGNVRDSTQILRAMISYLEKYNGTYIKSVA